MDGQRVRMGEGRGTEPAMGLMAEAEAATDRPHSAVFFAISLTKKVRPNGLREVDKRAKLHI